MYGYKKEVNFDFSIAVDKVKNSLAQEGFGIISEIDVKATMKKKLDIDYDDYVILGACNPPFANKVLNADMDIGLFLPCNVLVYRDSDRTVRVC